MIKGIFFDFDGVLIKLTEVHFVALNNAIKNIAGDKYTISEEEHNSIYNGLSTKTKLNLLVHNKGLNISLVDDIFNLKQKLTIDAIEELITPNMELRNDLTKLKNEGLFICCASNALLSTVEIGLKKLNIFDLFDSIIGNDYIERQKPAPDVYLHSFMKMGLDPKECLIVEDSKYGRESAYRSGAYICTVDNESDTKYDYIKKCIDKYCKPYNTKWVDTKLNILIPMAGLGSRFQQQGYILPKPLISVNGKTMIQTVVDNLNIDANFIFVVQKSHYEQYNLEIILPLIAPGCKIIQTEGLTEGAACTTLLAKEFIDNNEHLLIVNSDQFVEWNSCDFMSTMIHYEYDAGILTFEASESKWSYAKTGEDGFVNLVAEKDPISNEATVGIYYWKHGCDYISFARQMIYKNIRVKNEFYVCPVFNEAIIAGKKIKTFKTNKMWGLGTPEDLTFFLNNYSK